MGILQSINRHSIAILLVIIFALAAVLVGETILKSKTISFDVQDKCGLFLKVFSHSINDDSECRIACISQCNAVEAKYSFSDFAYGEKSCNTCSCNCLKG